MTHKPENRLLISVFRSFETRPLAFHPVFGPQVT